MATPRRRQPLSVLLGSVAYFYSTISNLVDLPPPNVIVDTNYGQVRGFRSMSRNGKPFYEFLGIRYAEAPVGDLRFEPPIKPSPWTGIKDARVYGSPCWQFERFTRNVIGSEDCLFLNVFTKQVFLKEEFDQSKLQPVLVFLHGGAYMAGMSNLYRPKYFMEQDVVLVTLNYRLASMGYLNTGDHVVRGNMGLKDQTMALKWIQENILYFGGDPDRVTLVGESAGAASVHFHILSNYSKGLFHRAISQSGSALNPWALTQKPKEQAIRLASKLNCPTETSEELVECLRTRSARSILQTHIDYSNEFIGDRLALFGPSIEGVNDDESFLTDHPRTLVEQGRIANHVPWIVGVNSEEGLIYAANAIKNATRRREVNDDWNRIAPLIFYYDEDPRSNEISGQIRDFYLNNGKINMANLEETVNMFSDREFFEGVHDSAVGHARVAPVYLYYYSYRGKFGFADILFSMTGSLPASLDTVFSSTTNWIRSNVLRQEKRNYGVCHADELPLFYNIPFITREINPGSSDYPFSTSMIRLWSSFAKKGKPTDFEGVDWTQVKTGNDLKYLKLDEYPRMIEEPFKERLEFWKSLNLDDVGPTRVKRSI